MFNLLKNLFRPKPAPSTLVSVAAARGPLETVAASTSGAQTAAVTRPGAEAITAVSKVETASLQLAAILTKFPEELKKLVVMPPPDNAMVTLPLPTVLKYLPTGSVKMSLASVVRQAPAGTFGPLPPHDKRMVEVPLGEIFKRVNPAILKQREDQRLTSLAEGDVDIFGDELNPRALTPRFVEPTAADAFTSAPVPAVPQPAPLKMPDFEAPPARVGPVPLPARELGAGEKQLAPTLSFARPSLATREVLVTRLRASAESESLLTVPIRELISAWPEPFKTEAASLDGAFVALPSERVSAGLARGKVMFSWNELRMWMSPPPGEPSAGDGETSLTLPLRILAPAFLNHSRPPNGSAKKLGIDESIPNLFSGERSPPASGPPPRELAAPRAEIAEVPAELAPVPVELASETIPACGVPPGERILTAEDQTVEPEPAAIEFRFAEDARLSPAAIEEPNAVVVLDDVRPIFEDSPAPDETPAPSAFADIFDDSAAKAPVEVANLRTLGDVFGRPEKATWSPKEIVDGLVQFPAIDGAIVALHEGLVVAHHLPEGMRGEIFAAFLPQIFGRLTQYGAEMKLGEVEEVTVRAGGRDCRFFRMDTVYFGVLAQPASPVPESDLRLCAAGLANT